MEGQVKSFYKTADGPMSEDDAIMNSHPLEDPQSGTILQSKGGPLCEEDIHSSVQSGHPESSDDAENHTRPAVSVINLSLATLPLTALMFTKTYATNELHTIPRGKSTLWRDYEGPNLFWRCLKFMNPSLTPLHGARAASPPNDGDELSDALQHFPFIVRNLARQPSNDGTAPEYRIDDKFISLFGPLPAAYVRHCIFDQPEKSKYKAGGMEWFRKQKKTEAPGKHFRVTYLPYTVKSAILNQNYWFSMQPYPVRAQIVHLLSIWGLEGLKGLMEAVDSFVFPSFVSVDRQWTWQIVKDRWRAVTAALLDHPVQFGKDVKSLRMQVQRSEGLPDCVEIPASHEQPETTQKPENEDDVATGAEATDVEAAESEDPLEFLREDARQLLSLPRQEDTRQNTDLRKALFSEDCALSAFITALWRPNYSVSLPHSVGAPHTEDDSDLPGMVSVKTTDTALAHIATMGPEVSTTD